MSQKLKIKAKDEDLIRPKPEFHKLQPVCASQSTILILPKKMVEKIGFKKGEYVRITQHSDSALLIERMD